MTRRLLDRQVSLIHYLTSGPAIFGQTDQRGTGPTVDGIDRRLLGIEARFSFEKRMAKIQDVFPRTLALMRADHNTLFRAFVEAYPPVDIGRLKNARQFHDFLSARWRLHQAEPRWLPDVAACELAFATARVLAQSNTTTPATSSPRNGRTWVRRSPAVVLLRCAHDIRVLFENSAVAEDPVARDVRLAVVAQPGADHPVILEFASEAFDLLDSLDEWVDQDAFLDVDHASSLVADHAAAGLIEIRR